MHNILRMYSVNQVWDFNDVTKAVTIVKFELNIQ